MRLLPGIVRIGSRIKGTRGLAHFQDMFEETAGFFEIPLNPGTFCLAFQQESQVQALLLLR